MCGKRTEQGARLRDQTKLGHQEIRYRLLSLLEKNPRMTQRQMAEAVGVSVGKVNYCVRGLVQKGFVKMQRFYQSTDKRAYRYLLTPSGIAEKARTTKRYLQRRMEEYEALKAEIERLQVEAAL